MRIFFICQRVPFPPDRGDKITTFNELKHLARNHEVYIFCPADGLGDLENIQHLREHARDITAVPIGALRKKARILGALFSGKPMSVAAFAERKLHTCIIKRFAELKPELMFVYSGNVAQYAEHFSQVIRIMQFADLDSLKWSAYAKSARAPWSWLYKLESTRLLAYERRIAKSFSHNLVCTNNERSDFEALIPKAPVTVVGNGVDLDYFCSSHQPKDMGSIIFTGVMDYLPNVDAVLWFCDHVLPAVQDQYSPANLIVCGRNPAAVVRRLANRRGIVVTGGVADVRPYLDRAELAVAPIRIARGIQNKVLEAMAMGLPVVASKSAWKGTVIERGEGILVADDSEQFARNVVWLLKNKEYRSEMSQKARSAVELHYRWDVQLAKLDEVISRLVNSH